LTVDGVFEQVSSIARADWLPPLKQNEQPAIRTRFYIPYSALSGVA